MFIFHIIVLIMLLLIFRFQGEIPFTTCLIPFPPAYKPASVLICFIFLNFYNGLKGSVIVKNIKYVDDNVNISPLPLKIKKNKNKQTKQNNKKTVKFIYVLLRPLAPSMLLRDWSI